MSAHRQRARRPVDITADLFAPPEAAMPLAPPPARMPPARMPTVRPPPPDPRALARPLTPHLWYAVVFPDVQESTAAGTLQRLSLHALQFTSMVSIEMPNALLLEIKGSVTLFGTMQALQTRMAAAWERLALRVHTATAPTTLAALWLARSGKGAFVEETRALAGALSELPIACTAWDPTWLQTLRSMGVTRLGDLLRLPRAGVARRLTPEAVTDLDIALARQTAPRRGFVSRRRFHERCDFDAEIETVAYLQKAIEPLMEHCAQFLRERQAGVQALELRLRHRVMPVTRLRVGLASITSDRRRLTDVLEERLGRLELPAPVKGMELLSGSLQPLSAVSLDAFSGLRGGGRDTAPELVERLRARLGETAVYQVAPVAEHRPEAAWQRVHELHLSTIVRKEHVPLAAMDVDMPRPVWLLAEPARLEISAADVQRLEGPERIESGWWDGKGVARDYYIAAQSGGSKWWVFQERHTKCWYLHGVFA